MVFFLAAEIKPDEVHTYNIEEILDQLETDPNTSKTYSINDLKDMIVTDKSDYKANELLQIPISTSSASECFKPLFI